MSTSIAWRISGPDTEEAQYVENMDILYPVDIQTLIRS
jgi:hypothetical protein